MYRIYAFLLIAVLLVVTVRGQESEEICEWKMRLKTGSDEAASTDATISAAITVTEDGRAVWTKPDINAYNTRMKEEDYVPFRKDQEDVFEFKGPCDEILCFYVEFENSGAGTDPSWQLASVEADVTFQTGSTGTYKYKEAVWIGGGEEVTTKPCLSA